VGEGADPEFPFGVSRKRLAVRSPSPGHEPPLLGLACPPEWSPSRVSELLVARAPPCPRRANALGSGVFPGPATRRSEEHRALSWASAPLQGFRPVAPADPSPGRLLPWGSSPLRRRPRTDPVHPGLPHPAPSGLRVSTLTPACSLRATPTRRLYAVRGVHPSGLDTFRPAAPVSRP
jgi:hypothetical protein